MLAYVRSNGTAAAAAGLCRPLVTGAECQIRGPSFKTTCQKAGTRQEVDVAASQPYVIQGPLTAEIANVRSPVRQFLGELCANGLRRADHWGELRVRRRGGPRSSVSSTRSSTVACSIGASSSGPVAQAASTPAWRLPDMTRRRCPVAGHSHPRGDLVEGTQGLVSEAHACLGLSAFPGNWVARDVGRLLQPRETAGPGGPPFPWRMVVSVAGTGSWGRVGRGWRWGRWRCSRSPRS